MKRALSIATALVVLAFAFNSQPTPTAQATAAPPDLRRPTAAEVSRHTRPTETSQAPIVVKAGDTYGRLAATHCGTFNAWRALQAANKWPERRIPIGATVAIACTAPATAATPAKTPAKAPARVTVPTTNGTWVHPLASGVQGHSPNCYHTSKRPNHAGVDLPQPSGTGVHAVTAGTVHRKAYQQGGAGYYVVIRHAANIYTVYMHLRAPSPLAIDTNVAAGQIIGNVGQTGNATGPHLHFEVHQGAYGRPINPAPFMRAHAINVGC